MKEVRCVSCYKPANGYLTDSTSRFNKYTPFCLECATKAKRDVEAVGVTVYALPLTATTK